MEGAVRVFGASLGAGQLAVTAERRFCCCPSGECYLVSVGLQADERVPEIPVCTLVSSLL